MTTARDELIDIQQRLVEELKENIYDTVGRNNVELDAYYRDYQLEFQRGYERLSTRDEIIQRLMRANIAYFGDYHTLRAAQTTVLDLLQGAAERGRKIVLAMEMIYAADKPQAQALMDGEIDDETYRWRVKWDNSWGFSWSSYKRFFAFCKEYDTPLFGLNINADKREYDDLHYRDMFSGELVSSLTQLYPERLVAVLYGDLHLAGNHLPAQVDASLAKYGAKRRSVRVYQNSETLYWQMVEQRLEHVVDYIKMRLDQYVVMNATPLVKFQSFANWQQRRQEIVWEGSDEVDLQAETALLDEVHHYVETIIAFLGIELEETANFELYTAADLDLLSSLVARGVYTAAEMDALKDYMSMAETAFFERARVLYIANFTVANAAEAAARYVLAEVRPTSNDAVDERDEFYARCMVEALAFFCSKIIDPRRHARGRPRDPPHRRGAGSGSVGVDVAPDGSGEAGQGRAIARDRTATGQHHREQPCRRRAGRLVRRHLPAAGGAGGHRRGGAAALGAGWRTRGPQHGDGHACRRSPGHRWPYGGALPGRDGRGIDTTGGTMNETEARDVVTTALSDVAPEIDLETLDPQMSLRNGADLDSMDFLAYVAAVSETVGRDIPEDDYDRMDTVAGAVAYLLEG